MKSFSTVFSGRHKKKHPDVEHVKCHCDGRHSPTCGCLTPAFVERARNNMSQLLKDSKSADDFKAKVEALSRHAHDEHQWEGGQCDFHPLRLCSCGKCDKMGTLYHTRLCLTCPLHKLAYEIELDNRGSKAKQYIHSVLRKGNSNLLEASHNVFIRFRQKALNLERLHYETSTNLALLQANLTYMSKKHGSTYHWIPELYKQMQLPVYDGLADKLQIYSKNRTKALEHRKTEKVKKKRIQLKCERVREAQTRKEWSAKHGNFEYYGAIVGKSEDEACICGSTSHMRTSHKDCSRNKKNQPQPRTDTDNKTDQNEVHGELFLGSDSDSDCTCGSLGRSHSRFCPMNPRSGHKKRTNPNCSGDTAQLAEDTKVGNSGDNDRTTATQPHINEPHINDRMPEKEKSNGSTDTDCGSRAGKEESTSRSTQQGVHKSSNGSTRNKKNQPHRRTSSHKKPTRKAWRLCMPTS